MGKKMAQGEGLTARQKQFLAVVLQTKYILQKFYLTGGTALSCWYLHHRKSYDLDFFSEQAVNSTYLTRWLTNNKKVLNIAKIVHEEQLGFNFYTLTFGNGDRLKVDFSYFPSERIEKGLVWHGLQIDSLYDIAVNKLNTIGSSPRGRDYFDLYMILQKNNWPIEKIRKDAAIKHGIHIDTIHLARQFLRVIEFEDTPKLLVPFNRKTMEDFFLKLAKSLEGEIFK
ncbi:MAG: nucleotidyl transferase AbiEii/AbiGii toxin family protein [Patescibacteria group bacterium]